MKACQAWSAIDECISEREARARLAQDEVPPGFGEQLLGLDGAVGNPILDESVEDIAASKVNASASRPSSAMVSYRTRKQSAVADRPVGLVTVRRPAVSVVLFPGMVFSLGSRAVWALPGRCVNCGRRPAGVRRSTNTARLR
ncbi:hypothetical protein ACXDF8_23020 [Mycolicibacterium sp. CBM1]